MLPASDMHVVSAGEHPVYQRFVRIILHGSLPLRVSPGTTTNYFGALTLRAAVAAFVRERFEMVRQTY